jgi:hypothetical protein
MPKSYIKKEIAIIIYSILKKFNIENYLLILIIDNIANNNKVLIDYF